MAAAFDEGADSDEVYARKGGKNKEKKGNKEKHQGKKKKKVESD